MSKQIKKAVKNVQKQVKDVKSPAKKPTKAPVKEAKVKSAEVKVVKPVQKPVEKPVRKSKYARHPQNPYREGSGYGLVFDILAAHKEGLRRDVLVKLYSQESGKDEKKGAMWDSTVVLSGSESNTGKRHRSAREGYWVKRTNDHVMLVIGK
jgi:outer membrane biosynthesis protein TonB